MPSEAHYLHRLLALVEVVAVLIVIWEDVLAIG